MFYILHKRVVYWKQTINFEFRFTSHDFIIPMFEQVFCVYLSKYVKYSIFIIYIPNTYNSLYFF